MKLVKLGIFTIGVLCQKARDAFPGEGLPLVNYTQEGKLDTSFIKLSGVEGEARQAFLDKLFDPPNLRALLVDDKLIFDTSDLGLPRIYARELLNEEVPHIKRRLRQRILTELKKYFRGQTPEEVQSYYRTMIASIQSYPGGFEQGILARYKALFEAHPGLNKNFKTVVKFNRQVFNSEVLDFVSDFFSYCNSYDPASATQLKNILNSLQENYNIFPRPYFKRVVDAYSGADSY